MVHVRGPDCQEQSLLQLGVGLMWMPLAATSGCSQDQGLGRAWEEKPHPGPSSDLGLQKQVGHSVASHWPSPQNGR